MKIIPIFNLFSIALKLLLISTVGVSSSLLGWGLASQPLLAQTELEVPLDDQARYLQDLNRTSSQAPTSSTPLSVNRSNSAEYQLSSEPVDYHVVEQRSHEWRNTSYNHNSAVTYTIYQFEDNGANKQVVGGR